MTTRRFVVSGRVQGVGFRWFTVRCAGREGVRGWVRNLPDGRVEIEAGGPGDAMLRFEREIRTGPTGARVDAVDVTELQSHLDCPGFSVR